MTVSERRKIMKSSSRETDSLGRFKSGTQSVLKRESFDPLLVGKKFGSLTVLTNEVHRAGKYGEAYISVRCNCGKEYLVYYVNMIAGKSHRCKSCSMKNGIPAWLQKRINAQRQRCVNKLDKNYRNYGGRGIEFRFSSTYEAAKWVMENLGVRKDLTLDRIDNDGHYEAGNLRWANMCVQSLNKRGSVFKEKFNPDHWPYSQNVVRRMLSSGKTRQHIFDSAKLAVQEKRKNWKSIQQKLESMTS